MGLLKEFKEFALKGNLVDIAVGFVMGATFTKIVTSFVDGMVMPIVGMLTGGVDFSDKVMVLKQASAEVKDAAGNVVTAASPAVDLKYGAFITFFYRSITDGDSGRPKKIDFCFKKGNLVDNLLIYQVSYCRFSIFFVPKL